MASGDKAVLIQMGAGETVSETAPAALDFLRAEGCAVSTVTMPYEGRLRHFLRILRWLPKLRSARMVWTDNYFTAANVSFLLWLTRGRAKHVVVGLNISSNRIFQSRWKAVNRLLNRVVFGRVDLAVVASRAEIALFHDLHDIPLDRFAFVHWAYDLPDLASGFTPPDRPYFCLIGRNNRDQQLFCEALQGLDAEGVIITQAPANVAPTENVHVLCDIPFGDCIACIRGAVANVVLVKDKQRGAGHITLVTAMHCARPQIVSDVDTVLDYLVPDRHALAVPLGDGAATRGAFEWMLDHPREADAMGKAGQDYAARWLTASARDAALSRLLQAWLADKPLPSVDAQWLALHEALQPGAETGAS